MREIKFRVYDKIAEKMRGWETVLRMNIGNVLRGICGMEVMQYTGLHDKNGKEIYEGDIVGAWSEGVYAIGQIKQRIDGLWLMYPAWQSGITWGLCPSPDGNTTVEVIGNIYQNPELLKGGE